MKYGGLLLLIVIISLVTSISVISMSLAQQAPPLPPPSIRVNLTADTYTIHVNDITVIRAVVTDLSGNPKPNETVNFTTTLGKITPISNKTDTNGVAVAHFQGTSEGVANVTAVIGNIQSNIVKIKIMEDNITTTPTTAPSSPTPTASGASGGGEVTTPTPTATATVTPEETPTPSPEVTATPTATPTLTPTPSPSLAGTPTPTVTASPVSSPTSGPSIPGFEGVFAIAGLLAVAYLVLWGKEMKKRKNVVENPIKRR